MRRVWIVVGIAFLLTVAAVLWVSTGTTESVDVLITRNVDPSGWYWVLYHLPTGGHLNTQINWREYRGYGILPLLLRNKVNHGRVFYGSLCCGEIESNSYVYLPTAEMNVGVQNLIFFDKDGSVWIIPVPEQLLSPEWMLPSPEFRKIIVPATIYR